MNKKSLDLNAVLIIHDENNSNDINDNNNNNNAEEKIFESINDINPKNVPIIINELNAAGIVDKTFELQSWQWLLENIQILLAPYTILTSNALLSELLQISCC